MQRRGKAKREVINTRHILFICSGAFDRLKEQIFRRLRQAGLGFGAEIKVVEDAAALRLATTRDFIDYGLEPEFIGRLPVRVVCEELSVDDLFAILKTSEGSVIRQYQRAFEAFGIEAVFDDGALREIAVQAAAEKTGARGLVTVCDRVFRDFKFELPGTGIHRLEVNAELVLDPTGALERILRLAQAAAERNRAERVRQFADAFSTKHGVNFALADDAVQLIVARAGEVSRDVVDYCENLFRDYPYGLKLLRDRNAETAFIVPAHALDDPDRYLSDRVVEFYRQNDAH
jgi:hypothetical protein